MLTTTVDFLFILNLCVKLRHMVPILEVRQGT